MRSEPRVHLRCFGCRADFRHQAGLIATGCDGNIFGARPQCEKWQFPAARPAQPVFSLPGSDHTAGSVGEISQLRSLKRTPHPAPFEGTNNTPAPSSACTRAMRLLRTGIRLPRSKSATVERPTRALSANSPCDHPSSPRAARQSAGEKNCSTSDKLFDILPCVIHFV